MRTFVLTVTTNTNTYSDKEDGDYFMLLQKARRVLAWLP